jgi:hypothetical protein
MGQLLAGTANHQSGGSFASIAVPAEEARELFHEADVDIPQASTKRLIRNASFGRLLPTISNKS